jgi:hypothetical protein
MSVDLSRRLHEAAQALEGERVSLAELLEAHGPAAQGSLLLLLAVPCLLPLPGSGTLMGLGVLALAVAMLRGAESAALPRRVAALSLPREGGRKVLRSLAWLHERAQRWTRERVPGLLSPWAARVTALGVALMAVVLVLPIPFGNILPSLALLAYGLGLASRDGVVVLAGHALALLTAGVTGGLLVAASGWAVGAASGAFA